MTPNRVPPKVDYVGHLQRIKADCQAPNWNSYGSDPVSDIAIEAATLLCDSLDVTPTRRGGIQIDLAVEGVTLEINAEGKIESACVDIGNTHEWLSRMGVAHNGS